MRQIRQDVFETNSSSTHSICISKEPVNVIPKKKVYFHFDEFGWESMRVDDTASYLYTAMKNLEMDDNISQMEEILNRHGAECEFENPEKGRGYWECGYVDHASELVEFISDLLSDEDKLIRYLFGDSCIYTGNDNDMDSNSMCYCAEETIFEEGPDGRWCEVLNPNHDSEHYEYYFKGN